MYPGSLQKIDKVLHWSVCNELWVILYIIPRFSSFHVSFFGCMHAAVPFHFASLCTERAMPGFWFLSQAESKRGERTQRALGDGSSPRHKGAALASCRRLSSDALAQSPVLLDSNLPRVTLGTFASASDLCSTVFFCPCSISTSFLDASRNCRCRSLLNTADWLLL